MNDLFLQLRHVFVINLFTDHNIEARFLRFLLIHGLYGMIICHILDFRNNLFVLGRCNLCAVFPVTFISVILRRIVACRNHDTGNAAQLTQSEGQFRRRPQSVEHISLDPVCIKT